MPLGINVNIEGNRTHRSRFALRYKNADKELQKTLKECVDRIFATSQELVPVDRGDLKESGTIVTNRQDGQVSSYTIRYGDGLDHRYGYIVEVRQYAPSGSEVAHTPPTQAWYMRDAWRNNEASTRATMHEAIKRLNRKLAK